MIDTPYSKLCKLVDNSDRPHDSAWLKDEIYAIGQTEGLTERYLELYNSGRKYSNPNNSTVAWLIGITDEEPSSYPKGLQILQGRISMPDIDIDIDDRKRDQVVEYTSEKYGEANVCHIGTFQTVKAKSAIKDATRALGFEYSVADELNNAMPPPVHGIPKSLRESLDTSRFRSAASKNDDTKKIVKTALSLEGVIRSTGVHAAGVVVTPTKVTDYIPVMQRRTRDTVGPVATQWDMWRVEDAGLLKLDFLGLRNLGVIDHCTRLIKERHGIDIDPDALPFDDQEVYAEIGQGNCIGLFQIESSGLRRMMTEMQPDCIEDIMAAIALFRPGPLGSDMDKLYINRKHGRDTSTQLHPEVEKLLSNSRGVLLYQEGVLNISRQLAGFSAAKADKLRKALGKKIKEQLDALKEDFLDGAEEVGVLTRSEAASLWAKIEYFAAYSFNAAHSASYSVITYQTAWLKTHYPTEYMTALLSSVTDNHEKTARYLNECRRLDIEVLVPSINSSERLYSVEGDRVVRMGLESIKGLGTNIVEEMIRRRERFGPFESLSDFFHNIGPQSTKKSVFLHLLYSGALDDLIEEQDEDVFFSFDDKNDIIQKEHEELQMFITENPLESIWHNVAPRVTEISDILDEIMDGMQVDIGGIITSVTEKKTRNNNLMYILQLEDLSGSVEVVAFPNQASNLEPQPGDLVLIKGSLNVRGDEDNPFISVIVNSLEELDTSQAGGGRPIMITLEYTPTDQQFERLLEVVKDNPGDKKVFLSFPSDIGLINSRVKRPVNKTAEQKIKELFNVV